MSDSVSPAASLPEKFFPASPEPQPLAVGDSHANTLPSPADSPKTVSPKTVSKSVRKEKVLRTLKPRQQAFVRAYADPKGSAFGNGAAAYQQSHPTCKSRNAASVRAYETLRTPDVQEALIEAGWDKQTLESELKKNVRKSWEQGKMGDHREAIVVLLKVGGHLIDRQEVTNMSNEQREAIRRAVAEQLSTPN